MSNDRQRRMQETRKQEHLQKSTLEKYIRTRAPPQHTHTYTHYVLVTNFTEKYSVLLHRYLRDNHKLSEYTSEPQINVYFAFSDNWKHCRWHSYIFCRHSALCSVWQQQYCWHNETGFKINNRGMDCVTWRVGGRKPPHTGGDIRFYLYQNGNERVVTIAAVTETNTERESCLLYTSRCV